MPELRVATWNTEWRETASIAAATIRERLAAFAPDILCLTECQAGFPGGWGGHVAEGGSDWGYKLREGRREVLLWSRSLWREKRTFVQGQLCTLPAQSGHPRRKTDPRPPKPWSRSEFAC